MTRPRSAFALLCALALISPRSFAAPLTIMPLGDSLTGEPRAYRLALYEVLTQRRFAGGAWRFVGTQHEQYPSDGAATLPPEQLQHEGYPGITIGGLAERIGATLASTHPDVVILQAGANDLASWQSARVQQLVGQYIALIGQIRVSCPTAVIYAGELTPQSPQLVQPYGENRADNVQAFNKLMAAALARLPGYGSKVKLLRHTLTAADLRDGLHPNEEGYRKFADDVANALR